MVSALDSRSSGTCSSASRGHCVGRGGGGEGGGNNTHTDLRQNGRSTKVIKSETNLTKTFLI